jgi:ribulose-5-phosphate 4-epimerase/fuculose-1-phosphate aldolase
VTLIRQSRWRPRWNPLLGILLTVLTSSLSAVAQVPGPDADEERIADLIDANHILWDQGVNDAQGHVSVRSAANAKHYFMARSLAPALVTRADVLEFDENGKSVGPLASGWQLYGERAIHTEIYRTRADVQAVVHSHPVEVLPFTFVARPFKPVSHMAFFLGADPTPVFDSRTVAGLRPDPRSPDLPMLNADDILIQDSVSGRKLAEVLGTRSVVLMRNHGMTNAAPTMKAAVYEAIYTVINARELQAALALGEPTYLTDREAKMMAARTLFPVGTLGRPWELWIASANARVHDLREKD